MRRRGAALRGTAPQAARSGICAVVANTVVKYDTRA